jgi:hypothetical protein
LNHVPHENYYLVGGLEHVFHNILYVMSSFPLTNIFQDSQTHQPVIYWRQIQFNSRRPLASPLWGLQRGIEDCAADFGATSPLASSKFYGETADFVAKQMKIP